ncbi:unnamed protein product [Closterium sp. NIES-54]
MECQGIIVKVRCLGCGGSGTILCPKCGGRGHKGLPADILLNGHHVQAWLRVPPAESAASPAAGAGAPASEESVITWTPKTAADVAGATVGSQLVAGSISLDSDLIGFSATGASTITLRLFKLPTTDPTGAGVAALSMCTTTRAHSRRREREDVLVEFKNAEEHERWGEELQRWRRTNVYPRLSFSPLSAVSPRPPFSPVSLISPFSPSSPLRAGRPSALLVVLNPVGGKGIARDIYKRDVEPLLKAADVKYELIETQRYRHAFDISRDMRVGQYDGVVCIGGDGIPAELSDGCLDMIVVRECTSMQLLELMMLMDENNGKHLASPLLQYIKVRALKLEAGGRVRQEPGRGGIVAVDGEVVARGVGAFGFESGKDPMDYGVPFHVTMNPGREEDELKRQRLNAELQRLQRLPPTSIYASHRIRVARRALELLAASSAQQRSTDQERELEALFASLSL